MVFYLMEDGTVYYTSIFAKKDDSVDGIKNIMMNYNAKGGFDAVGPIEGIENVKRIREVGAGLSMGGWWNTAIGTKNDGSFYDLSVIRNFIHH